MKSRTLMFLAAMSLFAALAVPLQLAAQRYIVTDIGTLGGTFTEANALNNKGWVVGDATLPGDTALHAILWRNGALTDLGTLGGPNSNAVFPLNERGEIGGVAETSTPDPLGEDFCSFGDHLICLPYLWQRGVMTPLPTLGAVAAMPKRSTTEAKWSALRRTPRQTPLA